MNSSKKFGAITFTPVKPSNLDELLAQRRLKVLGSSSSQGLNYSILTGVSIGTNYAYLGVPWSQAINLDLQEARDLAHDTLMLHPTEDRAVISQVEVAGQYHWMRRTYYCVTCGSIWDLFGEKAKLHSLVETHTREVVNGENDTQAAGRKRGGNRRKNHGKNHGGNKRGNAGGRKP